MQESDLALLERAAQKAAAVAVPFWGKSPKSWEKSGGAGPVTEADLAADATLRSFLLEARPEYGWLSEETEDNLSRLKHERVFIIDPIDGTRAFMAGERTWAHSLAVSYGGMITAAVVFLPLRDEMFSAALGQGAWLNGAPIHVSSTSRLTNADVLSPRCDLKPEHWRRDVPAIKHHFRPSLAFRLALVGQGRFDAMMTLRDTWEWDVAAGTLIVTEAGGHVSDRHGAAITFNQLSPTLPGLIAGTPRVQRALLASLANTSLNDGA